MKKYKLWIPLFLIIVAFVFIGAKRRPRGYPYASRTPFSMYQGIRLPQTIFYDNSDVAGGVVLPESTCIYDIGSDAYRWRTIYTQFINADSGIDFEGDLNMHKADIESVGTFYADTICPDAPERLTVKSDTVDFISGDLQNFILEDGRLTAEFLWNGSDSTKRDTVIRANAGQYTIYATAVDSEYMLGWNASGEKAIYGYANKEYGVYGNAGRDYGVYGYADSNFGVYGKAKYNAVYGQANGYYGVYGVAGNPMAIVPTINKSFGVVGIADNLYGVYGLAEDNYGIYGKALGNYGGFFYANNYALACSSAADADTGLWVK